MMDAWPEGIPLVSEWLQDPEDEKEWRRKYIFGANDSQVNYVQLLNDLSKKYPQAAINSYLGEDPIHKAPRIYQQGGGYARLWVTWEKSVAFLIN